MHRRLGYPRTQNCSSRTLSVSILLNHTLVVASGIPSTLSRDALEAFLGLDDGVAEGLASTPFLFTLFVPSPYVVLLFATETPRDICLGVAVATRRLDLLQPRVSTPL